jgi:Mn2+/Fe2+ NRAMP family transporter
VQALIYSAVLYGLVAPVIIGIILHICNNKKIMGEYTNTVWANIWGILTLVVMSAAAIALLYFLFF